jgi:hypothetical protein
MPIASRQRDEGLDWASRHDSASFKVLTYKCEGKEIAGFIVDGRSSVGYLLPLLVKYKIKNYSLRSEITVGHLV